MRNLSLLGAVGLLVCFAACQPAPVSPMPVLTETPTFAPSATSRFQPFTGPIVRATLPPTWTPTFTASPAPPMPTRTPTPTPTSAPTLTAAQVCAGFSLTDNLKDGQQFTTADTLALIFGTSTTDSVVRFLARLRGSDKNLGVQAPGGQLFEMQLALARLPGPGTYDWTLSVHVDAYGDLCARSGWFVLTEAPTVEATATVAATKTAVAVVTAASTLDATAEATIPIIYSSDLPLPMR